MRSIGLIVENEHTEQLYHLTIGVFLFQISACWGAITVGEKHHVMTKITRIRRRFQSD